jgi:hypothetical protein
MKETCPIYLLYSVDIGNEGTYFQHTSGIHTRLENSNILTQGLFARKVAYTLVRRVDGPLKWTGRGTEEKCLRDFLA